MKNTRSNFRKKKHSSKNKVTEKRKRCFINNNDNVVIVNDSSGSLTNRYEMKSMFEKETNIKSELTEKNISEQTNIKNLLSNCGGGECHDSDNDNSSAYALQHQRQIVKNIHFGVFSYFTRSVEAADNESCDEYDFINLYCELLALSPFVLFVRKNLPNNDDAEGEDFMTSDERKKLLTELRHVHEEKLFLSDDTFCTCVSIFDRFLSMNKMKIKFGAITCLASYSLAAYFHESIDDLPDRKVLLELFKYQGTTTAKTLQKVEEIIVGKLESHWPYFVETMGTILDYLRLFYLVYETTPSFEIRRLLCKALCNEYFMQCYPPQFIAYALMELDFTNDKLNRNKLSSETPARHHLLFFNNLNDSIHAFVNLRKCIADMMYFKQEMDTGERNDRLTRNSTLGNRTRSIGSISRSSYIAAKYGLLCTIPESQQV